MLPLSAADAAAGGPLEPASDGGGGVGGPLYRAALAQVVLPPRRRARVPDGPTSAARDDAEGERARDGGG